MIVEIRNHRTGDMHLCKLDDEFEGKERSKQLGAAVLAAVKRNIDLRDADLQHVDLRHANLKLVNLLNADLRYGSLRGADLQGASLRDADLRYANLENANLERADLRYANLQWANLQGANLQDADLRCANIANASLSANIARLDFNEWSVFVTAKETSIGCKTYPNESWLKWKPEDVIHFAAGASHWWATYGEAVKAVIRDVEAKERREKNEF